MQDRTGRAPDVDLVGGRWQGDGGTATGAGDVVSIKISKDVVDPDDVEMLEDLVLSGVKQAIEEGKRTAEAEMGKLTAGLGGMGLPGMGF